MASGGANQSGTTQYNWNDTLQPLWADATTWAKNLVDPTSPTGQYHQYTGPDGATYGSDPNLWLSSQNDPTHRIADLTPAQQAANQNISLYASDPTYGVADPNQAQNAGINYETNQLNGYYLNGAGADPWAYSMITNASNPYVGNSPQFNQMMQQGMSNITNAFNQGTAADTQRMFAQSGAFGGSAHQQAVANNANALGNQLSQYATGLQNDQYNRSAQLTDAQLGRDLTADTTNKTLGQQAYESGLDRMGQTLSPTQNEQNLALGRQNALSAVGGQQQQQNQQLLSQAYGDSQASKNQQFNMLSYLAGILGQAQGGVNANSISSLSGGGASPISQVIGGGILGSQLYNAYQGGGLL